MEFVGAFPDAEWDSISRMLNGDQGFGHYPFSHEHDDNFVIASTFCSSLEANISMNGVAESSFCSFDGLDSGLQHMFQETSVSLPSSSHECYYFNDSSALVNECNDGLGNPCDGPLPAMAIPAKRKVVDDFSETPKKKPRVSRAVQKSPKSNKTRKTIGNVKDEDPQSCSSCSSEDDVVSDEQTRVSPPMTVRGKTRASMGSATDPQSLYARKRREKINERLRILQTLVPNGTKVDISTMLEEAVQYVKFLQLQIKLLSSDDMWMYSPIAYNGMDIGLLNARLSPASL